MAASVDPTSSNKALRQAVQLWHQVEQGLAILRRALRLR